jgi:hypothetical protein
MPAGRRQFDLSSPAAYRFNSTIAGLEEAKAILLSAPTRAGKRRWSTPASARL